MGKSLSIILHLSAHNITQNFFNKVGHYIATLIYSNSLYFLNLTHAAAYMSG